MLFSAMYSVVAASPDEPSKRSSNIQKPAEALDFLLIQHLTRTKIQAIVEISLTQR
jgi:hypothetical protein